MTSNIIYKNNIQEDIKRNIYKIPNKRQNALFFTPPNMGHSSFIQADKIQNTFNSGKEKYKFSNITNNISQKKNKDIKLKGVKKQNISLTFANINKFLNKEVSHKNNNHNQYFSSKIKIKNKYISKIKENINSINAPKKNNIFNNYPKEKKINSNNNYKCFSGNKKTDHDNSVFKTVNTSFIYTDYRQKYNSFLHKDSSCNNHLIKNDLSKTKKNRKFNNTRNNNNNNIYKLKNEIDLSKNFKINKQNEILDREEKNNNQISKNIAINMNMNNSTKLTNISSYVTSEKNINSKKTANEGLSPSNNINLIKEKLLLKFKSNLNDEETQEYESKFLNFELGFSDKVSTENINYLDENLFNNNNVINNECEKPVEEIEKIANEIYNSEYKNKRISYINHRKDKKKSSYLSKDIGLNNDIEELKDGEEIQNVLTLNVNKRNK